LIRTARLTLRPARADDLHPLHAIFSDPQTMRYWDRPPHDDIAQTQRFLDGFMHGDPSQREEYILDLDGLCIGKAGCWRKAELGYILAREHWGKGYAHEACAALVPRCFARFPDAAELTAEVDPRNLRSIQLLERLGFRHVRTEERNFLYGDQEWCDTAYFACPRPQPLSAGAMR
jgi:RimJ/RimL family protein N-acetyltransferase